MRNHLVTVNVTIWLPNVKGGSFGSTAMCHGSPAQPDRVAIGLGRARLSASADLGGQRPPGGRAPRPRARLPAVIRRLVIGAIVAICLGGPIAELFDRWDQTVRDGNDTEANLVIAALCAGAAFAIGTSVVAGRIRALSSAPALPGVESRPPPPETASLLGPAPTISPPAALRV